MKIGCMECLLCQEIYNPHTGQCTNCGLVNECVLYCDDTSMRSCIRRNRFRYTRVAHFIGFIIRLEGGRTLTIPAKVIEDVRTCPIFTSEPTYDNVRKALRYTRNNEYYNHTVFIHHTITRVQPICISYLHQKLVDDFEAFQQHFDKTHKHRKNIFNYNLILHQLLLRHGIRNAYIHVHARTSRRVRQDRQCEQIFRELGWNSYERVYP